MARTKPPGTHRRRGRRLQITAAGVAAAAAVAGVIVAAWPHGDPDSIGLTVECDPVRVAPGQAIHLKYDVTRRGKTLNLGFGATLTDESSHETYDPAHDRTFPVHDGSGSYPRDFVVPAGTAGGDYQLLAQVWKGNIGDRAHTAAATATCPTIKVGSG